MKLHNIFIICVISTGSQLISSCTKTFDDIIETKSGVMQHNYIAISTADGSEVSIEVSYSVLDMHGDNIQLKRILTTPVVIGGENVLVSYDSIVQRVQSGREVTDIVSNIRRAIRRNYGVKGADNLYIKNLSNTPIQYCVIGNQSLKYYKSKEVDDFKLTNINTVEMNRVIAQVPSPIYNLAPILYLLKPELTPDNDAYAIWVNGSYNNGVVSVSELFGVKIPLNQSSVGEVSDNLPYSIDNIIQLYREEYHEGRKKLFFDYFDAGNFDIGVNHYNLSSKQNNASIMYGEIAPQQTLDNNGQIWFVNTNLGYLKVNEF